jgi:hypothetical protein
MRDVVKIRDRITDLTHAMKLVVAISVEKEIYLDELQDLEEEDRVFNFKQLISDYNRNDDNPIIVRLLGK